MKIYWDLDGVLRDLCTPTFGYEPPSWWHTNNKNQAICDLLEENLCIFATAPPTEYFDYAITTYEPLHIVTNQKDHWLPYTVEWLHSFIPTQFDVTYLKPEYKLEFIGRDNYIVEDYPFFMEYDNVILIDRPYNRQTTSAIRVKNVKELDEVIKDLYECTRKFWTLDKSP